MKVEYWYSGSSSQDYLNEGLKTYEKRIKKYLPIEIKSLSIPKTKSSEQKAEKEKEQIFKNLKQGDYFILLDENGQTFTSQAFSVYLQQLFNQGHQRLIFLSGSSHGFHEELKKRADAQISLSQMTFNHEQVRLIFLEQLYRSLTIIHNEPYHH